MQKHMLTILLQYIPEAMVMTFLIIVFLEERLVLSKICLIGVINGVLVYLFRLLPVTLGFHSVFGLFLYSILVNFFLKTSYLPTLIAILKSVILLTIVEIIFLNSIFFLTEINMEMLFDDLVLRSFIVIIQNLLLFTIGLSFYKYKHLLKKYLRGTLTCGNKTINGKIRETKS